MTILKNINKFRILLLIAAIGLGLAFYPPESKAEEKDKVIMNIIYQVLRANHFSPQELDDNFSDKAYDLFLENLDYSKRFLIEEDRQLLEQYRMLIDDQIRRSDLTFFNEAYAIYQERYHAVKTFYKDILAQPFDLEKDESLETDDEKKDYAANMADLQDRWRKYLKYRVLLRMDEMIMDHEKDSSTTGTEMNLLEMEQKARAKELETHEDWFKALDDLERIDWISAYMNAITALYDPHTQYFPPEKKEDFEINMTGQLQGIGAQLQQKGDYVTISKVIVGSPCWKQGDLEVGDKILKVEQEDGETVDLVGMSVRKAVKHIRGPKETVVKLTVRKLDGTKAEIPITRDIVELESTFAKSTVLGEGDDKVGYIRLPKFYVNFYGDQNHDCAQDVAAELEKLKAEGVKSVVLDLRNNGGGSLQGVIDIVGLFIDEGPVVQVKASGLKPKVLSDEKKGVVYDGPLVVMVNKFSASASEIFAAAIQDYKRGIIIGGNSTFGKGTVQNVVDMDRAVSLAYSDLKPLGALKLTIQKYYRINGGTPQLKGVQPDIVAPDNYMYIPYGEKEQEYALPYDEIEAADYEVWQNGVSAYMDIVSRSEARMDTNSKFAMIEDYARWIKKEQEQTTVPLQLAAFRAYQEEYRTEAKKYKGMRKSRSDLAIRSNRLDIAEIESSEENKEKRDNWHKSLRNDLYLSEAYLVALDLSSNY
ncbi:MAG: carboxy terminal-processing peptidase [Croceimicrobium sp.]